MAVQNKCNRCEATNAGWRCGGCTNVYYCSKNCQLNDWDVHQFHCASSNVVGANTCKSSLNICPTKSSETIDLRHKRMVEDAHHDALIAVQKLKTVLLQKGLNVVTIESLTSGMIAKMITDIPGAGAVLYGGLVVYDTDAKRLWAAVETAGVYSETTAYQMAKGALLNSRAMVSIAVTGHAMPFFTDKEEIGKVDIGIALRTKGNITINTCHVDTCSDGFNAMCVAWIDLHRPADPTKPMSTQNIKSPPFQMTAYLADAIRLTTVAVAVNMAIKTINAYTGNMETLPTKSWDLDCAPSWVIKEHLPKTAVVSPVEPMGCDDTSIKHREDLPKL